MGDSARGHDHRRRPHGQTSSHEDNRLPRPAGIQPPSTQPQVVPSVQQAPGSAFNKECHTSSPPPTSSTSHYASQPSQQQPGVQPFYDMGNNIYVVNPPQSFIDSYRGAPQSSGRAQMPLPPGIPGYADSPALAPVPLRGNKADQGVERHRDELHREHQTSGSQMPLQSPIQLERTEMPETTQKSDGEQMPRSQVHEENQTNQAYEMGPCGFMHPINSMKKARETLDPNSHAGSQAHKQTPQRQENDKRQKTPSNQGNQNPASTFSPGQQRTNQPIASQDTTAASALVSAALTSPRNPRFDPTCDTLDDPAPTQRTPSRSIYSPARSMPSATQDSTDEIPPAISADLLERGTQGLQHLLGHVELQRDQLIELAVRLKEREKECKRLKVEKGRLEWMLERVEKKNEELLAKVARGEGGDMVTKE